MLHFRKYIVIFTRNFYLHTIFGEKIVQIIAIHSHLSCWHPLHPPVGNPGFATARSLYPLLQVSRPSDDLFPMNRTFKPLKNFKQCRLYLAEHFYVQLIRIVVLTLGGKPTKTMGERTKTIAC